MKVCSIYNVEDKLKKPVGFLLYYENEEYFHIDIMRDADIENMPFIMTLFAEKGEYSIGSYWSRRFVESRIVPRDRQNLGSILKSAGLDYYDEYKLLISSNGICSHDNYALEEVSVEEYRKIMGESLSVIDAVSDGNDMMVFFSDDTTRAYECEDLAQNKGTIKYLKKNIDDFRVMPGGHEINFNDVVVIEINSLKKTGKPINAPYEYFRRFAQNNIVNTAGACEGLECSRQNIDDLVRRGRLKPVMTYSKNKLFLKADIERKKW